MDCRRHGICSGLLGGLLGLLILALTGCTTVEPVAKKEKGSEGMVRASRGRLAPVYAPLAEYIVSEFDLADGEGIGIDVGSGPGTLIVELAKRTKYHWINADINPKCFTYFHALAAENDLTGRVSSIQADVHELPFHDNYADVIVSRGSYWSWEDKARGFREMYRVLKPGGLAYIGRGFSPNLPLETARQIRAGQGKSMKYPFAEKAAEMKQIMQDAGITDYKIYNPSEVHGNEVNYGIWVEFHKPGQGS